MKRFVCLLAVCALLLAAMAGCGGSQTAAENVSAQSAGTAAAQSEAAAPETAPAESAAGPDETAPAALSLPLTQDDVTLTMFAATNSNVTDMIDDLNNHQNYKRAEELTGVHIQIEAYTTETASTKFSLMFASGDLTDLIRMGATSYTNGLAGALDQDYIVNLTDYLQTDAPSYYTILTADPSINLDVRTDDSDVLGFFQIYSQDGGYDISIARGPMMRADLLEKLNVQAPTTYNELHDDLLAFKTDYGLSDPLWIGNSPFSDDSALIGGYDVTNGFYQIDGTVHYGPCEDNFRSYMEMMAQWYSEGILNRDFYDYEDNPNSPTNEALKYSGQAGMHYSSASNMDNYNARTTSGDPDFNLVGVPFIAGADGMNHFGQDTFAVKPMGCMTVTTACKSPELAIQWCDFWYSEEGSLLSNYGIEGQTFEYDENGQPHWTDFITNNPDGTSYVVCRQVYLTLTQQPGIYKMDMELEQLSDAGTEAVKTWNASADGAYLMPVSYSLTAEENEQLSSILSDIDTLNDETWIKLVTGDESFDDYDAYLQKLDSMGIQNAISIYQTALDRYYSRQG